MAPEYVQGKLPLFPDDRGDRGRLVTVRRHLDPDAIARYPKLTDRLVQVGDLLAEEKSNKEIAERLELSRNTIKSYVARLMSIVDADSRAGIVMALTTAPPDGPVRLRSKEESA